MIWGVVIGAAIVVAVAGVAKLAKPAVTTEALRSAGFAVPPVVASLLGLVELLVGVLVVVWHPPAGAVVLGLLYLGFVAFSLRLLSLRGATASCGCFGQRNAPIGVEHIVVNLAVAALVFGAAAGVGPRTVDPVAVVGATALLFVLLAVVPSLRVAGR